MRLNHFFLLLPNDLRLTCGRPRPLPHMRFLIGRAGAGRRTDARRSNARQVQPRVRRRQPHDIAGQAMLKRVRDETLRIHVALACGRLLIPQSAELRGALGRAKS